LHQTTVQEAKKDHKQTERQEGRHSQVREYSKDLEHEGICVLVHRRIATEALVGGMSLQYVATGMVWLILIIFQSCKGGRRAAKRTSGFVTVI